VVFHNQYLDHLCSHFNPEIDPSILPRLRNLKNTAFLIKERPGFPEDGRGNEVHTPGHRPRFFRLNKMIQELKLGWFPSSFLQDLNDFLFEIIKEEALSDPTNILAIPASTQIQMEGNARL
jgi:hypothetical protein